MNNTLKTIVWITAGVAVVCLSIAAVLFLTTDKAESLKPGNGFAVDQQESFSIGGIEHVAVQTSSTDVYVSAGEGDRLQMRLHGTVYTGEPDSVPTLAAEKTGKLIDISLERRDGGRRVLGFFSTDLILEIIIPQSYGGALAVDTSSGDVEISSQNLSELSLHTSSGDLRLNSIQATTISMESSSGDHAAVGLITGQATIRSSSGEIRVRDLEGSVKAESSSGDITLRYREFAGNVEVKSSSGDVDLFLTESAGFQVEARASSGDIDCSYPVTLSGAGSEMRKNRLYGIVGTGTQRVSVTTSSGDITIQP